LFTVLAFGPLDAFSDPVIVELPHVQVQAHPASLLAVHLVEPIHAGRTEVLTEDVIRIVDFALTGRTADAADLGYTPEDVDIVLRSLQPLIDGTPYYRLYPEITAKIENSLPYRDLARRIFSSVGFGRLRKVTSRRQLEQIRWTMQGFLGEWMLARSMTHLASDSLEDLTTLFADLRMELIRASIGDERLGRIFQGETLLILTKSPADRYLMREIADALVSPAFAPTYEHLMARANRSWMDRLGHFTIPVALVLPAYALWLMWDAPPNMSELMFFGFVESKLIGSAIFSRLNKVWRRHRTGEISRPLQAECQRILNRVD
jgi:hypothetical protein